MVSIRDKSPRNNIPITAAQMKQVWIAIGALGCLLVLILLKDHDGGSSLLHVEVQSQKVAVNGANAALRSSTDTRSLQDAMDGSLRLWTAGEMKRSMRLPCNYVHDGFYIKDSNEVLNQIYQSLLEMDDDVIPVAIECGGHDGITKSLSLKSSICLNMNTLLIEASPINYNVLKQSRAYDFTVNKALCSGESVQIVQNLGNSGETHVAKDTKEAEGAESVVTVQCTSIDAELDQLKATLPAHQQDKLQLIFLVLDIEGHEAMAIDGIQKYSPKSVSMETAKNKDKNKILEWAAKHGLELSKDNGNDSCFNCKNFLKEKGAHLKKLLYAARYKVTSHSVKTGSASQGYMYYGS